MSKSKTVDECPKCGVPIPHLTAECAYCGESLELEEARFPPTKTRRGKKRKPRTEGESGEPDSPDELVAYFSEHIGKITSGWSRERNKHACEAALTKLKAFSVNDAGLAKVTLDLQDQFHAACAVRKRSETKIIVGCVAFLVLFFALVGFLAFNQISGQVRVREEVQRLIGDGKFDEARTRARDLKLKHKIDEMLQAIDGAEAGENQRESK